MNFQNWYATHGDAKKSEPFLNVEATDAAPEISLVTKKRNYFIEYELLANFTSL